MISRAEAYYREHTHYTTAWKGDAELGVGAC